MAYSGNAGLCDPLLRLKREPVFPARVILAAPSNVHFLQGILSSSCLSQRSARPNLPLLPKQDSLFRHPITSSTPSSDSGLPAIPPR
jgi:hypothetical protein